MKRRVAALWAVLGLLGGCGSGTSESYLPQHFPPAAQPSQATAPPRPPQSRAPASPGARNQAGRGVGRLTVGLRTVVFWEPGGGPGSTARTSRPRRLVTLIRYPALALRGGTDVGGAAASQLHPPYPLIIFAHGFNITPAPYAALLNAWVQAGYIVAAPVFPYENANAPGGPDESDLINQPRDVSYLMTRLLRSNENPMSFLAGQINRRRIAVAGQSDGGETALAVAYDRFFIDPRVSAAVILSGAKIPNVGGFFDTGSGSDRRLPALLATQGTADTVNLPRFTYDFFGEAPRPKYLLQLFGAPHLGPYTNEQPQLGIVERASTAFLDAYLRGSRGALRRIATAGDVPGVSSINAVP